MEEPPEHVVFILCTTDAHKVPATIQSRCQRFDFKNIPTAKIADHLAQVIKAEGYTADTELLHTVARMGEGSMRDALSLLDRLLAIEQQLGRVRRERYGPRTIDLDLLLYGDEIVREPGLTVPHPRLEERRFALEPLSDLDPGLAIPGSGPISALLAELQ